MGCGLSERRSLLVIGNLVPDDGLIETVHEVSPLGANAPGLIKIRTLIKTGNLTCWQGPLSDQV